MVQPSKVQPRPAFRLTDRDEKVLAWLKHDIGVGNVSVILRMGLWSLAKERGYKDQKQEAAPLDFAEVR